MKIVYIGSSTILSYLPLHALIESNRMVCAIAMEGRQGSSPREHSLPVVVEGSFSIASLALMHDIPLIELTDDWPVLVERLTEIAPDVILVSCFGRKLPDELVSIPHRGCFNLHPSWLPGFRGPAPVFWQMRSGIEPLGTSLHCVSSEIDAGDIVAQAHVSVPDGANRQKVDGLLAEAGSRLIEATLREIECGSLQRTPQVRSSASYQKLPTPDDYVVSTRWTARRMYNFICAIRAPGIVFPCEVDGRIYRLTEAKSFRDSGDIRPSVKGKNISINCSRGIVEAIYEVDNE
ncbi:MAG: formyltransferase family protein [Arenicellales bacterium]|nr:formyltransferase family protein [Arenicellales bacterium]